MTCKAFMAVVPFYCDVLRPNRDDLPVSAGSPLKQTRVPTFSCLDCVGVTIENRLFRLRPCLRVNRRNCSLRQVRIHGACADGKPYRQNVKSKSFRLIFCLKHSSSSLLLSAYSNERDIPLLREHQCSGFAGHFHHRRKLLAVTDLP